MLKTQGHGAYESFPVRIKRGGRYLADFSKVAVIKNPNDPAKHLGGGDPHSNQSGGTGRRDKYEVITLE